ncbi:NAD-dependent epimerase/dehydratase family protein [Deinococcus psychrotolerans]|uniref:NAD-dependent epimerase/dehydratase family protein n=1 Tax=Deinococcus psychrotolerans TaxID=2489213 RepID=A0A3G8YC59_9DEIO|nr:NAD(P)H-binding protein [Deinococcus psychrotolerans]AZI42969.1 NAD-dependent epimerase/dehydratase family protein [Deinococcus psychrotolerans]
MNITFFGATGRTGSEILRRALQDGHEVRALVRSPEKSTAQAGLTLVQGDVRDAEAVRQTIAGADAVMSALGTDSATTLTEATAAIIQGMKEHGVARIVTIGTAGILESRTEPGKLRYQTSDSRRKQTFAAEEHQKAYEMLRDSPLDWTVICPTYLPDGEAVGGYRTQRDYLPVDGQQISTGDTAAYAYAELLAKEHIGYRVGIAY